MEGGRAHGPYGHESQGLKSATSLSPPTALSLQSLGDASSVITCSGDLGGPHQASDGADE